MGGAVCTLSGVGRHCLSTVVTYLNLILAFFGSVLVAAALAIKFLLEGRMAVVMGNHSGALAYFLITLGCILGIICVTSAKVTYDAGFIEMSTPHTCKLLLFCLACQGQALFLLIVAIINCLVHKTLIHEIVHTGMIAAIRLYRADVHVKAGVDRIQAHFHCCGSRSVTDWFQTPWIPMKYINLDHPDVAKYMVDGEFVKDDAPFSCCDVQAARPCAHHDVHNISAHRQLGPLGTLYTTGCNDKLEWYWQSHVLTPLLLLLFFVSFVLILSMALTRMLQTSLRGALEKGNPAGDGEAFCCSSCHCGTPDWISHLASHNVLGEYVTGEKTRDKRDIGDRRDRNIATRNVSHNRSTNHSQNGFTDGAEREEITWKTEATDSTRDSKGERQTKTDQLDRPHKTLGRGPGRQDKSAKGCDSNITTAGNNAVATRVRRYEKRDNRRAGAKPRRAILKRSTSYKR